MLENTKAGWKKDLEDHDKKHPKAAKVRKWILRGLAAGAIVGGTFVGVKAIEMKKDADEGAIDVDYTEIPDSEAEVDSKENNSEENVG